MIFNTFRKNFYEIFPTKLSILVFLFYIALFINQGVLVTASQKSNNSYTYNTVLAVLVTEVIKLSISLTMYCYSHSVTSLFVETILHLRLLFFYFVSATLYCLYNNLSYINLLTYDPTTYFLLLQLRVVVTGLMYQVLFKKYLSFTQWISLLLLTVGCMLKEIKIDLFHNSPSPSSLSKNTFRVKETAAHFNFAFILIAIQLLSSCFAGVYNEFLLKNKGEHVSLPLQNIFMCWDSILCNSVILLWQWDKEVFSTQSFQSITQPIVIAVMVNNALVGITTSFFLKYLNSILKTFASSLELVFIAIISWIIFDMAIHLNTVLSIAVVSFAVILYSRNPVPSPKNMLPHVHLKEQPA